MRGVRSGEQLAGRYELGEVLGRGGMGEVRAAHDHRLCRPVAVKTLRPDLASRTEVRRRFEAEARAAGRLAHPNVVAVHDVGEEDGAPFIVMERLPGSGLEREMAAGPMDPARARQVAQGILAALGAAHAAGIVHRDVKPGNVLLDAGGAVKVTDFGIAKALADTGGGTTADVDPTGDGQLVGTVAYMAPEQVDGAPASVQSDLYSVGVILYEALAGEKPFTATTPITLCWAVHRGDYQPLAARRPDLDPRLVATVERAMARRSEDRFASAAEMAAALAETTADPDSAPTVALGPATAVLPEPPLAAPAPAITPARKRATWPVAAAAAGLCLALAWVVSGLGSGPEPASRADARPPAPGASAGAGAPDGGIPAPLDDALTDLEEVLR